MSRFVLGIDDGTTAVKVALFDDELRPVRTATRRVATAHPHPGWVEQDPHAVLGKAGAMYPPLAGLEPVSGYAGLRPAGRDGVNYLIGPSSRCPGLVNVAAIRSTGLTASLGIAEHVTGIVSDLGVPLGPEAPLAGGMPEPDGAPAGEWWRRTALHRA